LKSYWWINCEIWEITGLWTTKQLIAFWNWSGTYSGYRVIFKDSPVFHWCEKWKWI